MPKIFGKFEHFWKFFLNFWKFFFEFFENVFGNFWKVDIEDIMQKFDIIFNKIILFFEIF